MIEKVNYVLYMHDLKSFAMNKIPRNIDYSRNFHEG